MNLLPTRALLRSQVALCVLAQLALVACAPGAIADEPASPAVVKQLGDPKPTEADPLSRLLEVEDLPAPPSATSPREPALPAQEAPAIDDAELDQADAGEPLPWIEGLKPGIAQAQISGKPALVFGGGEGCVWCRRLKLEMEQPAVRQALRKWTLVYVDIEQSPDAALTLGVGPIPALRLLRSSGAKVAGRDGFVKGEELAKWLNEQAAAASDLPDVVLTSAAETDEVSVSRLVASLEDRDPLIREAALQRLATVPELAGPPLVKLLAEGNLAARLAALELLAQWEAPVAELDPWRPATLTESRLAALRTWQQAYVPADHPPADALTEKQWSEVRAQIDRLLTLDLEQGAPIRARLARFGPLLLPEVYARLKQVDSDEARQKLLVLRYRLVASDQLVLKFPGGLARLAAVDAPLRRQAAQRLVDLTTAVDQPLLLELFSDADPLIREIALRGLKELGGEQATASLVRLLQDPEPNVRAAVLKQLAEEAPPGMVGEVATYVGTETDADLLVHAIRYFREVKGTKAVEALLPLLSHSAWQVRAEAAEALDKSLDRELRDSRTELVVSAYAALIERLEDEDPFVVSRAVDSLRSSDMAIAVPPLAKAAEKHPQLAPRILSTLTYGSEMSAKALPHLKRFAKHQDPQIRAAALSGIYRVMPAGIGEWAIAGLQDESDLVRLAALEVTTEALDSICNQQRSEMMSNDSYTNDLPFYAEPTQPTLTQRALSLFGFGSGSSQAEPAEPENPADETPAKKEETPQEDGKEGDQKPAEPETPATDAAQPPDNPWDAWLEKLYAGKGRPAWMAEATEPLLRILESDRPDERFAAARLLIPLGHGEQGLPALRDAEKLSPVQYQAAVEALPWLVWKDREPLFQQLQAEAGSSDRLTALMRSMAVPIDARAAELFWGVLEKEPAVNDDLAGRINSALTESLVGSEYRIRQQSPEARQRQVAQLQTQLKSKQEMVRLVALVQLTGWDKPAARQAAQAIVDDPQAEETLRRDAFQVLLVTGDEKEQNALAVAAIQGDDPRRQQLAVELLVVGANSLSYLRDYAFSLSVEYSGSGYPSGGPIIPTAPEGLLPEHVRPLLKHSDPKTRAYAAYLLAILGDKAGLDSLLAYWRASGDQYYSVPRLVYRAIAKTNSAEHLPALREIYGTLDTYERREFYWTVRIMSGDEILNFRKQMREDIGIENLR